MDLLSPDDAGPSLDLTGGALKADTPGYRVLARKYRPSTFEDLIGQEAMVRTLSNAFDAGRIAQAYVFTGVRGVGKTTTARILARALNYHIPGEIDRPSVHLAKPGIHCKSIMEGRHVDVLEIDAASHTGIDDVRAITDGARYAPVSARYKVYIVDEVHMLSEKAWNAFLKTLEEPPAHVKFMFATTEIKKVPVTVLSRCQRFDLKRVDANVVTAHMRRIAQAEAVDVSDEALGLIARAGEGSVRDSLSMLDQAIAHGSGAVDADAVRAMLGLADRARIIDLFEEVMKGDLAAALTTMRSLYDAGAEPAALLGDLAEFVHFVTRTKVVPAAADDVSLSETERSRGKAFAARLSHRVLTRAWQMLMKGIDEVARSPKPLASAEMVLVRIAYAADLPTPDEALRLLADPGTPGAGMPAPRAPSGGAGGAQAQAQPRLSAVASVPEGAPAARAMAQPVEAPRMQGPVLKGFPDVVKLAGEKRDLLLKTQLESDVRLVRFEDGRIDIALARPQATAVVGDLQRKLSDWTGRRWLVVLSTEQGAATLRETRDAEAAERERGVKADPLVQAVLARFPGAEVVAVRPFGLPDDAGQGGAVSSPPANSDGDLDFDGFEPVAPWDEDF